MATHIKALNIRAFRGIRNLKINELSASNIITGDNITGKTSFLEVLRISEEPAEISSLLRIGRAEQLPYKIGVSAYEPLVKLFNINDKDKIIDYNIIKANGIQHRIRIEAEEEQETLTTNEIDEISLERSRTEYFFDEDEEERLIDVKKLNLVFKVNDKVENIKDFYEFQRFRFSNKEKHSMNNNTIYISPFRHVEGNVYLTDILNTPVLYQEMLEVLKEFDDNIISINADKDDSQFYNNVVYKILSKNHNEALPLNVYGDGMKKAILLMSAIIKAKGGILLLDEFETAIHTSAMNRVF